MAHNPDANAFTPATATFALISPMPNCVSAACPRAVRPLLLSALLVVLLPGCGALITAAQMSGKMPSTEAVVNAAVRTARALTPAEQELRTIAAGDAVSGSLTEAHEQLEDGSHFATWFYTGTAGETVQIDLWSDDFEPFLIVGFMEGGLEGSFEQIASAGDVGAGSPVTLSWTLDRSGLYAIVANTVEPGQTGSYRLRVMER